MPMPMATSTYPLTASSADVRPRPKPSLWGVQCFPRVLDHRDGRDLDVRELAVDLLDFADANVLYDVARDRVDLDRAAGTVWVLPMREERHRLVGSEFTLGRFDEVVNRGHVVPAVNGEKVGDRLVAVFLGPGGEERLVRRPVAGG